MNSATGLLMLIEQTEHFSASLTSDQSKGKNNQLAPVSTLQYALVETIVLGSNKNRLGVKNLKPVRPDPDL
jgi:hypothetical protein